MPEQEQGEREKQARLMEHKKQLQDYGLRGLEGRMQNGLDPAAMLAVKEVRTKVEEIANLLGGDVNKLDELTKELHVGGVWKNAERLSKAEDPEAVAWLVLASETQERNAAEELLDDDGYLQDVARITAELAELSQDLDEVKERAKAEVERRSGMYEKIDGVAYSEKGYPYLDMAIAGEESGVWKDGELYFIGADTIDFDSLESEGYEKIVKEDRGREATFFVKDGVDAVKQLYPGFGIVLNGDRNLAFELARTAQTKE